MSVRPSRLGRRAFSIARLRALQECSGFFMRSKLFQILIVLVSYLRSYDLVLTTSSLAFLSSSCK
eukprot:8937164-Pyramimonas_sp.AAC.1